MSQEQQTLADVQAVIDALPPEHKAEVLKFAGIFRNAIREQGPLAQMAFALVGAELAAEDEEA
jgi:hypothetical protein